MSAQAENKESDEKLVDYAEKLALVRFSEDEREKLKREIPKIFQLFSTLMEIEEIRHYEPLYYVHDTAGLLREDSADSKHSLSISELEAMTRIEKGFVKAPRTVVESGEEDFG